LLDTLPARDFLAGYGEVVKYGLLGDAVLRLARSAWPGAGRRRPALRQEAVRRSVEMKAGIVARDETETGERALLNLGHTFGHALEAATGYSDRLLHGEGVAIGCQLAFDLSRGWACARRRRPAGWPRICRRWGCAPTWPTFRATAARCRGADRADGAGQEGAGRRASLRFVLQRARHRPRAFVTDEGCRPTLTCPLRALQRRPTIALCRCAAPGPPSSTMVPFWAAKR
jgi:3-dehydroquinate synthase